MRTLSTRPRRTALLTRAACALAACAALIAGCRPPPPDRAVLHLREALPATLPPFDRVSSTQWDLGSLAPDAPAAAESRSCGDVVAFAVDAPDLRGAIAVEAVELDLWWDSGVDRGYLALGTPGLGPPLFGLALDATEAAEGVVSEGDFHRVQTRVEVGRTLDTEQLQRLVLTLDAAGSSVAVATCPWRASRLTLVREGAAPAPDAITTTNTPNCLPTLASVRPPRLAEPLAAPPATRELGIDRVDGHLLLDGEAVRHAGPLVVTGTLELAGATLRLAPRDDTFDGAPRLVVEPGGALVVRDGSWLVADAPAVGFVVEVRAGARLELTDSTALYPGSTFLDEQQYVRTPSAGFFVEADGARITGNRFRHGLVVLRLTGAGAVVEDNLFERDGTAIVASGRGGRVAGNVSRGDGRFVVLQDGARDWTVTGNTALHSLEKGIWLHRGGHGIELVDNRVLHGNIGLEIEPVTGSRVVGNEVRACRRALSIADEARASSELLDNVLLGSRDPACPPRQQGGR